MWWRFLREPVSEQIKNWWRKRSKKVYDTDDKRKAWQEEFNKLGYNNTVEKDKN
jgi:hypothetical protein